jgi:competence protein ComEC
VPFVGELLVSSTDLLSSLLFATALRAADLLGAWSLSTGLWKLTLLGFFPLFLVLGLHGSPRSRAWKISLFFAFFLLQPGTRKAPLRVDILDVGQGDAILITTPSLRTILVDTGGGLSAALAIERHIKGLGLSGIDLLVISHFHQDHVGGLPFLLNRIPITRVAFSSNSRDAYHKNGAPEDGFGRAPLSWIVHRGDTLFVDEQIRIFVLAPSAVEEPDSIRPLGSTASELERVSVNDQTVVLKIVFGETSFLLTGDAELNTEAGLVKDFGGLLSSDVVKLAHHGSSTSSSLPFIIRASKKDGFAAISVGEKNRFGHPSTDVIRRWLSQGTRVSATSRVGAISYLSNGSVVEIP